MNFELNEDQRAVQDSLRRLLADRYVFESRRVVAESGKGHDEETWAGLSELGLTALLVPETLDGFGCGAVDLFALMQELGAVLCLEPLLAANVLPVTALKIFDAEECSKDALRELATGERKLAWAHEEAARRHAPWWIETSASEEGGKWILNGRKVNVLGVGQPDQYIVSARVRGSPADPDGCALFFVEAREAGLDVRGFRLVDDTSASELVLRGVAATPIGDPMDGRRALQAIDSAVSIGIAASCADMVGAASAAFRLAVDYLNTRKQFGRLIGENQALRHRASEMLVSLELAKSMAMAAAVAVDDPDSEGAALDLHRAKLSVAKHARAVAHGAIQLHGGIGMTEEYAVGHYLRRIHVMDQLFGDGDAHASKLASLIHAL